jgi:hypothetical protein
MERLLEESRVSGEILSEINPRRAAYHLSCLINGFYRLYHVAPDWGRDKALTKTMFKNYFDGLARPEQAGGQA